MEINDTITIAAVTVPNGVPLVVDDPEEIVVATKAGRRLSPHTADGYNEANLTAFIEDSLRNLATDSLDLVQLHCPPTDVYYRPELFDVLDRLAHLFAG